MRRHSTPLIALLATAVLAAGLALVAGCDTRPDEPVYDNPFDPEGPLGGDGLEVSAIAQDTTILVFWNLYRNLGIETYIVRHRSDPDDRFEFLAELEHPLNVFTHDNPVPDRWNQYEVQAFGADPAADFTLVGYAVPGEAVALPRLEPATGDSIRASRFMDLLITVNVGDTLRLADNDSFAADTLVAVADTGTPQLVGWDMGLASGRERRKVFLEVTGPGGYRSDVAALRFWLDFAPDFGVVGDPASVATRLVDLEIPTEGVLAMRFALSEAGLADEPWLPPAAFHENFLLAETANSQLIYGEFQGDAGYDIVTTEYVKPDPLNRVTFEISIKTKITDVRDIEVSNTAVATEMRISESPDFAGTPWVARQDTFLFTLSPEPGRKVLYSQFRNDWAQSAILSDWIDYLSAPVSVTFLAPSQDDLIAGGLSLQVRGGASSGTLSTVLDSVRLDLGDSEGWRKVDGREDWSYLWDVPRLARDETRIMRARAWASGPDSSYSPPIITSDSVTVAIEIMITQLTIDINEPLDGSIVAADSLLTIAGTASPWRDSEVDSVAVSVEDEPLNVTGTTGWSTTWRTPTPVAEQTYTITATVWSAGDTWSDTVDVTVQGP